MWWWGVLLTIVVFLGWLSPTIFAYTITYDPIPNQPKFTRIPTVCAVPPTDDQLSQNQLNMIMEEAQNRVQEWSAQLQVGSAHPENWLIKYLQQNPKQTMKFDASTCDIVMAFKPQPNQNDPTQHNWLGVETYLSDYGYRYIEIYYMQKDYCQNSISDYNHPGCSPGLLPPDELGNVILHEMGHALGMNHYLSDDPKVNYFWATSPNDAPSILVPFAVVNPYHQLIKTIDLDKIHQLYNYEGFLAFIQKDTDPFLSLTATAYLIERNGDYIPEVGVFANISPQFYSGGQKIKFMITDMEGHLIDEESFLASRPNMGVNLTPQGFPPGTYTLTAIYSGMTSPEISFKYSGYEQSNSNLSNTSTTPQPEIVQIPSWIKTNAKWWYEGTLGDDEFLKGIEYLLQKGIIKVPETKSMTGSSKEIPPWVKNNAGWWSRDLISDQDFEEGIKYLIIQDILKP